MDVLGTCYDDKTRPPPLMHAHVLRYLAGDGGGGGCGGGDGGSSRGNGGGVGLGTCAGSGQQRPGGSGAAAWAKVGGELQLAGPVAWQLVFEGQDPAGPARGLAMSAGTLDFGACSRLSPAEPLVVTLTNNTPHKLWVVASVPGWRDPAAPPAGGGGSPPRSPSPEARSGGGVRGASPGGGGAVRRSAGGVGRGQHAVFQVFPETLELRPGASTVARVAFRPPKDGQHYCCTLQVRAPAGGWSAGERITRRTAAPPRHTWRA